MIKDRGTNMKTNLRDYPKFYRWLTLPFSREPYLVQVLQRMNRILTFAMPGIYVLVFCWLFLKKTSMGGIWSFIWIPASGFVLFSLFRHWVNVPRPYEKWDIQPLLEKIHPVIPFLADMFFRRPLSPCVSVSCLFR